MPSRTIALLVLLGFLACSKSPSTLEEYIEQGDRQFAAGDLAQAIASYRMAFHRDTLNPVVLARLAKAYKKRGNPAAADRYLRWAMNITYEKGVSALQAGNDTAAVAAFERTLEIHPPHPLALNHLGDIYLARGQEDKALRHYEKSAEANPHFAETFLKLGQLRLARGEREEARQAFERAIQANLNATKAYLGLGEIYLQEKKWADAAEQFRKALLIRPHSSAALSGLEKAQRHL